MFLNALQSKNKNYYKTNIIYCFSIIIICLAINSIIYKLKEGAQKIKKK